jgi:hypothetical protein
MRRDRRYNYTLDHGLGDVGRDIAVPANLFLGGRDYFSSLTVTDNSRIGVVEFDGQRVEGNCNETLCRS